MIKFELNGMQYRIRFKHYTREQLLDSENSERMPNALCPPNGATYAILDMRIDEKWNVQTFKAAFCMFLDTFSKARGRKLALKRLLESAELFKIQPKREGVFYVHPGRDRDLRLKIWRLYFDKVRAVDKFMFLASLRKQDEKQ